jgi:arylsulfatase A-like enzyme
MTSTVLELTGLEQPDWVQGQSLLPLMLGQAPPDHHRDFVRCEYFDALDANKTRAPSGPLGTVFQPGDKEVEGFKSSPGTFATMYRNSRYKLSVYHGHNLGELYDLEKDPWEFENLWDSPAHQDIKNELIFASFDSHVLLTTDVGSPRIAPR